MSYNPPRQQAPTPTGQPLEIDLVFNVTACGTCSFFWPPDPAAQPYGPYPAFDFLDSDTPVAPDPDPAAPSFQWLTAQTAAPAFPTPEIMDGCRKAPIMTIGINPNLTAFAPGRNGTSWCYPNFTDGDIWARYAYYYRYRSVYQERLDLDFVEQYLLAQPRVVAPRPGVVVSAERPTDSPTFTLKVRYDGDLVETPIELAGETGAPRWVVLFDTTEPDNRFQAGDVLAARLKVPAGLQAQLYRQQVGYYEQFVPVLQRFQETLRGAGHPRAQLTMGEDVCQLDMVACASPHWNPGFLGGTPQSEREIVHNCVAGNAWAVKQLVQTRPAVLYIVSEATWNMFHGALGAHVQRDPPLSPQPADGAFTLLRESTDPEHPVELVLETELDGVPYDLRTRLVITPHFSYATNFTPQIRLAPEAWAELQRSDPACAQLLQSDAPRIVHVPGTEAGDYTAFLLADASVLPELADRFPASAPTLTANLYDPHALMADVLDDLYAKGTLTYGPLDGAGNTEALARSEGSCRFCANELWSFPLGCPYGKPAEPSPPAGLLERVAAQLLAGGNPPAQAPQ